MLAEHSQKALMELRSVNSRISSWLHCHNTTERYVNMYWIGYQGQHIRYATILPHGASKMNTFVSHPWMFRDKYTGEHLIIGRNEIFWPEQTIHRSLNNPEVWLQTRKNVYVHFPMRTLRLNCQWKIVGELAKKIQGEKKTFEDLKQLIDNMPLPEILKTDLKLMLQSVKDYHNNDR